jgi:ubiquinone/menaquinone biosynthesis C-methylase UbiE
MNNIIAVRHGTSVVHFWDAYAKWYQLWIEHNTYYGPILKFVMDMVEPGWKVLDIGAGNGILSLPLCAMGCEVTALEPSVGMRSLFYKEAFRQEIDTMEVDERRWEDVPVFEYMDFDLIIACNSLHLPDMGFSASLEKVFRADPRNIFVVTEHIPEAMIRFSYASHTLRFAATYEADNSFAYHHLEEVFDHHRFKKGQMLLPEEKTAIMKKIVFRDKHIRIHATAQVGMYWFHRRPSRSPYI